MAERQEVNLTTLRALKVNMQNMTAAMEALLVDHKWTPDEVAELEDIQTAAKQLAFEARTCFDCHHGQRP